MIQIIKQDGTSLSQGTIQVIDKDGRVKGLAGEQGPEGPEGPQGPPGAGTADTYTHTQSLPSTLWTVTHNLGFYPGGVSVFDSTGRLVVSDVEHININTLTITFAAGFSGVAYIS